jgi:hypothetical protein
VTSALLFSARLSDKWWCDAWRWSAQLINLRPISSLQVTVKELEELKIKNPNKFRKFKKPFNISPYYAFYQEPRDIRNFRQFGATCFCWIPGRDKQNLASPAATKALYVGLSTSGRAWLMVDPITGRRFASTHCSCIEDWRARCTWLETLDYQLSTLRAEATSYDPAGLGLDNVNELSDEKVQEIIRANHLSKFRELWADPRSPFHNLSPDDPQVTISNIFHDEEASAEAGEEFYDDEIKSPEPMECLDALIPQQCPLDRKCTNVRCPYNNENGRAAFEETTGKRITIPVQDFDANPPKRLPCSRVTSDFTKEEKAWLENEWVTNPDRRLFFLTTLPNGTKPKGKLSPSAEPSKSFSRMHG